MEFGRLLRGYRLRAGWTQEELAERSGISAHAISVLESGRRRPRLSSLAALATGACLALTRRFVVQSASGGLSVTFAAVSMIVAMTSPLIFAPDTLAFPFMVLGYVGLTAYSRIRFGTRNWWRVGHECRVMSIEAVTPGFVSSRTESREPSFSR